MVTIISKNYVEGLGWYVECRVETDSGSRSGTEYVNLPEDATDEELKEAVLASYA